MWSAISKIFTKKSDCGIEKQGGEEITAAKGDQPEMDDTKQAKQRASVKWLLSKAFNNNVPENLREPFYSDHENQEHLKPQIVGALANAEIYCLALGNIYSDPNYHRLNHNAILQTLARKSVYINEPPDAQLTETVLIQTNPLRISAHMAVIESIMVLYAREVVTPDRVLAAVQRFSYGRQAPPSVPENYEKGLLLWISHACLALGKRIEQDFDDGKGDSGDRAKAPNLPNVAELKDLVDGIALAALISYYCPDELPWNELRVSYVPNVQDSLYNLSLVQDFCDRCVPASIFHLQPEDVTYMREAMKQNLIVFLADLFNVIEIHPIKCVKYPGMERFTEGFPPRNEHGVAHKRNLLQTIVTPIPDLRSGLNESTINPFQVTKLTPTHVPLRKTNSCQQSIISDMSEDSLRRGSEDSFVVHHGKNIPTLRSVGQENVVLRHIIKEKQNYDSKADERGEVAAGRPSNWEENRKSSFAGRRSRRNSTSDDSQLTIENFGGSQDNINFIGRNPDKELGVHSGRKISTPSFPVAIENPAVRSSAQDARGSFQLGDGCEKIDYETEKFPNIKLKRQLSSDDISLRNVIKNDNNHLIADAIDGEISLNKMSFADLNSKQKKIIDNNSIQMVYMQHGDDGVETAKKTVPKTNGTEKKTSFAQLPNTTTWQQQSSNSQFGESNGKGGGEGSGSGHVNPAQLNDVRMKLEEKRRLIESEKKRMEVAMSKQRQKVGKAAFLQAVAKGKGNLLKTPSDGGGDVESNNSNSTTGSESQSPTPTTSAPVVVTKPQRPFTLKEISDDTTAVEKKWLDDSQPFIETRKTPDLDNMDMEQYQHSLAQMNSSLSDIQTDIQRLASQQSQIQQQNVIAQQQKQIQALQQQQQQYQSMQQQFNLQQQLYNQPQYPQPPQKLFPSASAPHIPQSFYAPQTQPQFFLHDQTPPPIPQRRTWAQPPHPPHEIYHQQQQQQPTPPQPELRTWGTKPQQTSSPNTTGFILHGHGDYYRLNQPQPYQNGGTATHIDDNKPQLHHSNSFTLSQQHLLHHQPGNYGTSHHSTPSASPQHHRQLHQLSQLIDDGAAKRNPVSLQQIEPQALRKSSSVTHAPIPAPSADDMEPQNISFIGNADAVNADKLAEGLNRINITSGSRTYRIPSPTRPPITKNSFQPTNKVELNETNEIGEVSSLLDDDPTSKKGFYITFDDDQPKRPKPPLRKNRGSPKKERSYTDLKETLNESGAKRRQLEAELEELRRQDEKEVERRREMEKMRVRRETSQGGEGQSKAIIIEPAGGNPDPDVAERMKQRIYMASLQRKQEMEEAKARKDHEAQMRREKEKEKEEEKLRKKEEQIARRAAILEQYKLKKAMDEADREGKVFDKSDLMGSLKPTPKMRPKAAQRPRPKTIHIDSGSVELAEGMMPSRGKKGSTSNLTANSTMKRDYYRGSQDSLADRSMLYRDSPDDSRGVSPCHSANQTLGRRSSYKTSRDPSPAQVRGRPKYSNYQNFKGRKSSSLMNLYGSSTDQDSLAYRYGDTDSGLGRATPPRRAPSPGMGSVRHLPSPSGPGSLPGLMSRGRRMFDDGSSDISSTPSSMMDYNGPRLYKQPATKSNRGIMLNAVEYCVFPGVVNREAKRRVLEEMNRSEGKHFLILFRDAGCQFRALYSYCPEGEEVLKLYGTGPKQVNDRMFDKFFKYNSGGKCFSQIHTKHLTVTIDAFTIHNSLWQGKKVNLPNKKDMALVI